MIRFVAIPVGLAVLASVTPANAQIVRGVMTVTGAEMH